MNVLVSPVVGGVEHGKEFYVSLSLSLSLFDVSNKNTNVAGEEG